jgi:outer membrane lipoprotein-sorting protein
MKTKIVIVSVIVVFLGLAVWLISSNKIMDSLKDADLNGKTGEVSQDLVEVLAKAEKIESLKYNVEITDNYQTSIIRFWQKQGKIRMEMSAQGQEVVFLTDQETSYMFFPVQNRATKMDLGQSQEVIDSSITEQSLALLEYDLVVLGSEKVDNKDCLIVQHSADDYQTKMWIWKEYGLPIKAEIQTEQGLIKHQVKDVEFVDIPDNVFQLPPGVETMEIPSFY